MSNLLAFGKDVVGGGNSSGGGHIIQNASDTDLTQRDTLQFKGGLKATDDSINEKTVVDGSPNEITWEQYNAMTPEQQQALEHTLVTGVPSADGTISVDLMTKLWENPDTTASFAAQNIDLSSGDYDILLIIYRISTLGSRHSSEISSKSLNFTLTYPDGNSQRRRDISYANATQLTASDATYNGSTDNTSCVPASIYGIKKTVTVTFDALARDVSTLASNCMLSDGVTSVESALDELNADIIGESISVTGNGSKTIKQLLNELYALYDPSKLTPNSKMYVLGSDNSVLSVFYVVTSLYYTRQYVSNNSMQCESYKLDATNSAYLFVTVLSNQINFGDGAAGVLANGRKIVLHY